MQGTLYKAQKPFLNCMQYDQKRHYWFASALENLGPYKSDVFLLFATELQKVVLPIWLPKKIHAHITINLDLSSVGNDHSLILASKVKFYLQLSLLDCDNVLTRLSRLKWPYVITACLDLSLNWKCKCDVM